MRQIIVLIGPTASGKSDFSLKKAEELNAHIISADAFQVYKGMDIGTAKLTDFKGITHHLIDIKWPNESYNVTEFIKKTQHLLTENPAQNYIITGGTAMYLHALIYNYQFPSTHENPTPNKYTEETAWQELYKKDPLLAQKIPKENHRRVLRSLEILEKSQNTMTQSRSKAHLADTKYTVIGIARERNTLIERINQRVDHMISEGLIEEVETLTQKYPRTLQAFQAIGYKEVIEYLENKLKKDEMIEKIKIKTRQFAKRQMTWFRRFESATWIEG